MTSDVKIRELLNMLADEERKHTKAAGEYEEKHLTEQAKDMEEQLHRRLFMLQYVQPGLAGLMDGSVLRSRHYLPPRSPPRKAGTRSWSAWPPVSARAFPWDSRNRFLTTALSPGAALLIRGAVTGLMTTAGGLGHTLPYLIPQFRLATGVAVMVVAVELGAISYIRHRYMDTPFLQAAFQVILGGVLVFLTGWLIGSS